MSSTTIWTNTCRCCMSEGEQMQNIFDKFLDVGPNINPDITYSEAIYLCTNIQFYTIDDDDDLATGLSQFICEECLRELRIAVNFRAKCEETDAVLRKSLDGNEQYVLIKEDQIESSTVEELELRDNDSLLKIEEATQDDSSIQYLEGQSETTHSTSLVIVDNSESDFGSASHLNAKDFIISYDIENIPIVSDENSNVPDTIEVEINTQQLEIEVLDEKQINYCVTQKNVAKHKNWFECEHCKKGFSLEKTLKKHIEFAHNGRTLHLCNVCGQLCSHESSLKSHMLQHQEKKYNCDECSRGYFSKKGLESHRLQHNNVQPERKFLCSICGKDFTTGQRLKIHIFTHTGEKNYSCDACNKSFATESRLRSHLRIHTGERPYECAICGLTFAQSNALKCHKRVHTGEKPYTCKFCGKCFSQHTILKTHLTLHTGKMVKCPDCDKKFSRASYLILHRREHTGEKPYACDRCPNRYKQKSHLDRHMDTHLGVKHKCQLCNKEYSKQWSLKMHMFSHSDKKPFQCPKCLLSFIRKDKYKMHLKTSHSSVLSETNKLLPINTSEIELEISSS